MNQDQLIIGCSVLLSFLHQRMQGGAQTYLISVPGYPSKHLREGLVYVSVKPGLCETQAAQLRLRIILGKHIPKNFFD